MIYLILILTAAGAQTTARRFGIEANQFVVESGFGASTELQVYILDNTGKRFSLGLYYDSRLNTIGGFSISANKMLGKYRKSYFRTIEPYLFYNLIYHRTTITKPVQSDNFIVSIGTYKSMEHHAGFGLKANISKRFYLKGEIGYGLYLGSIMKPSKPDLVLNESCGTHGTGMLVKIGMGVSF